MKRLALPSVLLLALVCAMAGIVLTEATRTDADPINPHDSLIGKQVQLFFSDQTHRQGTLECFYVLVGTVKTANQYQLKLLTTKAGTNQQVGYSDGSVQSSVNTKEYKHEVVVPWAAVKYVKIVPPSK